MTEHELSIRSAGPGDDRTIFAFINDPEIRGQSFYPAPITWEQHAAWYQKKITSDDFLMLIAETKNLDFIGQVRYEKMDAESIRVGIFINPKHKNAGFGHRLLSATGLTALQIFNMKKIVAEIKKQNAGSVRAFEKAGYRFWRETEIAGVPAIALILERS